MLTARLLTAIVLVPIFLLALFFLPPLGFLLLVTVVALIGGYEWCNLMEIKKLRWRLAYLAILIYTLFLALYIPINSLFLVSAIWWVLAAVLVICYPRGKFIWNRSIVLRAVMGIFVLMPSWAALNYLRNQTDGIYVLLYLFVLIWSADTFAYIAGKKWGRHKLAPLVSPGKSWEGAIAALLSSIFISLLAQWFFKIPMHMWMWGALIAFITIVFSIVGDLFESMLKREVNLKDSSQLLPGHGGLLDRIDSLTAAAPIFAFVAIIGNYLARNYYA